MLSGITNDKYYVSLTVLEHIGLVSGLDYYNTIEIAPSDIVAGSPSWSWDITGMSDFKLGTANASKFSCTLFNDDGKYDDVDFMVSVIEPFISVTPYSSGVQRGTYIVTDAKKQGKTISLTGYDVMAMLDMPVSDASPLNPTTLKPDYTKSVAITWSATSIIKDVLSDLCFYIGIPISPKHSDGEVYESIIFTNCTGTMGISSDDFDGTVRDLIGYMAQIGGCYAYFDNLGRLDIDRIYSPGVTAEYDFNNDLSVDGNTASLEFGFFYDTTEAVEINNIMSLPTIGTKPYRISGILVAYDGDTKFVKTGTNTYNIYAVSGNPLITTETRATAVMNAIAQHMLNVIYYPFDVSALANPYMEAGDAVYIVEDGKKKVSILTSYNLRLGSNCRYAFDVDPYDSQSFAEVWKEIKK